MRTDAYFANPPEGPPAYVEVRVGDYEGELGIIDRRYAPPSDTAGPGGAIAYWHVDDLEATLERALSLGASEHQPVTDRGDSGFRTASVIDPFGNILGLMRNPHYLEILGGRSQEC